MNTKQLQYAIELAEVCNFSKVSEKLNISQPALSKQIIHLEADLGVKLFDRQHSPLRLTPAGEYFIKEAKDLLYRQEQLKRSLEHYQSGERGQLRIGVSQFRSLYLIPRIAKKLRERFPGVQISLCDTNSEQIRKDLTEGKLDFSIVNLPVDDSVLEYVPIEPDILVLAVPNELLNKMSSPPMNKFSPIDFACCADLPFVVVEPTKEMRHSFEKLCAVAEIRPQIAMEVVGLSTAWAMARAGIGATLLPLQFVKEEPFENADLTLFQIKDEAYQRQPVIVTRRGQYLSEYARYAITLLTETDAAE